MCCRFRLVDARRSPQPARAREAAHGQRDAERERVAGVGRNAAGQLGDPAQPELADRLALVLAARASASFPGAFPPLMIEEIDSLAREVGRTWHTRGAFLRRVMPMHVRDNTVASAALIDGAVASRLGPQAPALPRWHQLQDRFSTATRLEAAFWTLAG